MMREPIEADDLLVRSIQPTRSNSFNNEGENDLRMLPWHKRFFIKQFHCNLQSVYIFRLGFWSLYSIRRQWLTLLHFNCIFNFIKKSKEKT